MLDFNHILNTPGYDLQQFTSVNSQPPATGAGGQQWQTWRKPRGCNFVYFLGVGGGGSGAPSNNAGTGAGGGGGGGSGAQASVLLPAMFVPDVLYIQAGMGGKPAATIVSATAGTSGNTTYISVEPFETVIPLTNSVVLIAPGGGGGSAVAGTGAGAAGAAGVAPTIATMPLAGRGQYSLLAGQIGTTGGNGTAGTTGATLTIPVTGLMVTGGTGGGGVFATGPVSGTGGAITSAPGGVSALNTDIWPLSIPAATAAVTATPAANGVNGIIVKNMMMNFGGSGGGAASTTAGGIAGAGGNGAPGSGGGGAGASNSTVTTLARPGEGGDGFVYIISF